MTASATQSHTKAHSVYGAIAEGSEDDGLMTSATELRQAKEADAAKAAFLHEAVRITGAPCAIHRSRIEDLAPWPCDVVTARAISHTVQMAERFFEDYETMLPEIGDPEEAKVEVGDHDFIGRLTTERHDDPAVPGRAQRRLIAIPDDERTTTRGTDVHPGRLR